MRIFDGGLAWKWPNKSLWINMKQIVLVAVLGKGVSCELWVYCIWEYLVAFDSLLEPLRAFDNLCKPLKPIENLSNSLRNFRIFECLWEHLSTFLSLWKPLETFGSFLKTFKTFHILVKDCDSNEPFLLWTTLKFKFIWMFALLPKKGYKMVIGSLTCCLLDELLNETFFDLFSIWWLLYAFTFHRVLWHYSRRGKETCFGKF